MKNAGAAARVEGENAAPAPGGRVRGWLMRALGWLALAVLTGAGSARYFAAESYYADLLTSFHMQLTVASGLLLAILLVLRLKLAGLLAGLLFAAQLWGAVIPAAGHEPAAGVRVYKLISFNMLSRNQSYEAVRTYLRRENPDFVVLQEYADAWTAQLEPLFDRYPYRFIHPGPGIDGVSILSRYPAERRTQERPVLKSVMVEVSVPEGDFLLLAVHLLSPVRERYWEHRNGSLERLGGFAAAPDEPLLIAGDFNCTPWAAHFTPLRRVSGLSWLVDGPLAEATWRPFHEVPGVSGLLGIPIDHALATRDFRLVSHEAGPGGLGSDHKPIEVAFVFQPVEAAAKQ